MTDFIRQIIDRDLAAGRYPGGVVTRFPPEPNGFLHIGHAKSIVLNFGLAEACAPARCHLRFDDTNPTTEDEVYVRAIQNDVRWLGFDWGEHLYFASDYFETMYGYAESLIERGLAYVDSGSEEEIRAGRGTVTEPGTPSPYRTRTVDENLTLFRQMRDGAFPDGAHVLRARIDMASPNMLMRDPVLYRIRHAHHHRTGDAWCIYPLYDYAHALEDALEHVTHSLCTLEFDNNRELYDWVVTHCPVPSRPHQYEFARLNLEYTVMSKRKLLRLVTEGDVTGWDDPRMPTVAGLRRRGVTPEAIRAFCEMIGVAKADSRVDMAKLEYAIRDDLNPRAPRVLCVLKPLKVVLTNWEEGRVEWLEAPLWPHDIPKEGSRAVPFTRELWIEADDFAEVPPKGFRRLVPGGAVRLRHGYVIRCDEVVKDASGAVVALHCRVDHATRSGGEGASDFGWSPSAVLHWVSASEAKPVRIHLYDRLFSVADPDDAAARAGGDFRDHLNPASLEVLSEAWIEPWVLEQDPAQHFQFERLGFFRRDPVETPEGIVMNRVVTLRDAWAKGQAEGKAGDRKTGSKGASLGGGLGSREAAAPGERAAGSPPQAPVLPEALRPRAAALEASFGLPSTDAALLVREPELEAFFRKATEGHGRATLPAPTAKGIANLLIHALPPLRRGTSWAELRLTSEATAVLVALMESGVISSTGGGQVLEALVSGGGDPEAHVQEMDLALQRGDDVLRPLVEGVVAAHPDKAQGYREGKTGLMGFFMGQAMRAAEGKGDPERIRALLEAALGPSTSS